MGQGRRSREPDPAAGSAPDHYRTEQPRIHVEGLRISAELSWRMTRVGREATEGAASR